MVCLCVFACVIDCVIVLTLFTGSFATASCCECGLKVEGQVIKEDVINQVRSLIRATQAYH